MTVHFRPGQRAALLSQSVSIKQVQFSLTTLSSGSQTVVQEPLVVLSGGTWVFPCLVQG